MKKMNSSIDMSLEIMFIFLETSRSGRLEPKVIGIDVFNHFK